MAAQQRTRSPSPWIGRLLLAVSVAAVAILVRERLRDPSVALFVAEDGARWIRAPEPFSHIGRGASQEAALFRVAFEVERVPSEAVLTVRAFRTPVVQLDGRDVAPPPRDPAAWKEPFEIDLAPLLAPGAHHLVVGALARNAHPCVLVHAGSLGIASGPNWEASRDGATWAPAACVDEPETLALWNRIPSVPEAIGRKAGWLLFLFAAGFAWSFARARGRFVALACTPSRLRWILLGAWTILGANDFLKLPLGLGFDVSGHMDYVRHVAERGRLPLAHEGWEMYQAPLHYVLSALLDRGLGLLGATSTEHALRWIPLACGALQVEVAYRTLRLAFPDREDVQCVGLWIAGLLPVNLYVSQFVGNEPLAGLASAIVALRCVRAIARPEETHPFREAAWIGLALGVALLSKMTAVIWIPLTGVALIGGALARERKAGPAVARAGLAFGVAGLVAGWFYARNWIELGRPLVGNWDWKESNRIWWQDPGYRIPEHFTRFGSSLVQPVYSAVHGYWDAMYSTLWTEGLFSGSMSPPPWNLDWMLAGAWLGLPVTAAILAGMLGAGRLTEPAGRVRRFAVLAVLLHVLASLDFYLRLPIYSSAKATYLLGLLPCLAILAAAGFAPLLRRGWSRAAATAMLFVFGAASYTAYFVL